MKKQLQKLAEEAQELPAQKVPVGDSLVGLYFLVVIVSLALPPSATAWLKRRSLAMAAAVKQVIPYQFLWKEEPSLHRLFEALKIGPAADTPLLDGTPLDSGVKEEDPKEKLDWVTAQIAALRKGLANAGRASSPDEAQKELAELGKLFKEVKQQVCAPNLRGLWQLTSALEALANKLASRPGNLNDSCVKTIAGALDCLRMLCNSDGRTALQFDSAIRLLVVDDDAVCQRALAFALKNSLAAPELALTGEAGLALAEQKAYDIIFMDIEMPGMDGFEACSKIRQTARNRGTPVVFVTSHSDFQSRAKAAISGGFELISKPFVALEVAVKALTLILVSRLRLESAPESKEGNPATLPSAEMTLVEANEPAPAAKPAQTEERSITDTAKTIIATLLPTASEPPDTALPRLGQMQARVHKLHAQASEARLPSAERLGRSLEELIKRLVDKPKSSSATALDAAESAAALLEELCQNRSQVNLSEPPIRILTVDDDAISGRAIASAIQLVFGKPDTADCGEAAIALARERTYDLIFMDIMMPGMDGFQACEEILRGELNHETPVVFVTGRADQESREKAKQVGGSGFISKPILSKEILVTALTFTLRGRLKRHAAAAETAVA